MAIDFHASFVTVEVTDGFQLIGFADNQFDTRDYLLLQRSQEDDEQDIRLGMNTYHVERNEQRWSCYGGIQTFELHRSRVRLTFTKQGALDVGNVSELEIAFQIGDADFTAMKDGLDQVFADTGCLLVKAPSLKSN